MPPRTRAKTTTAKRYLCDPDVTEGFKNYRGSVLAAQIEIYRTATLYNDHVSRTLRSQQLDPDDMRVRSVI